MSSPDVQSRILVFLVTDLKYLSRCAAAIETGNVENCSLVLAMDEHVETLLPYLPNLRILRDSEFLAKHDSVRSAIDGRSRAEAIFTIGPSALLSSSNLVRDGGWLVYSDSDLFFAGPLEGYLDEFRDANVLIAPHRHFLWNKRRLEKYGIYNVGLVAFRKNQEGLRALQFWAESCLEWCYDRAEDGKYADQKYLEKFASVSEGVFVDNSLGANLAPWNSFLKKISATKSGEIFVGRDKLMYFHAQGLKQKNGRWILGHLNYLSFAGPRLKKLVYSPYLAKLEEWSQKPGFKAFGTSRTPTTLLGKLTASLMYSLSLLTGQTIKVGTARSEAQE